MIYITRTRKSGCLIHKTHCCNVCLCARKRKRYRTANRIKDATAKMKYFLHVEAEEFFHHWSILNSDITQDLAMLQERRTPITAARALGGDSITSF